MNSIDLNSNVTIRAATLADEASIRQVHLAAFGAEENEQVASLACALLREAAEPEMVHLVADAGDALRGHVAFSPVFGCASGECVAYILAPLAVAPQSQKKGVGKALVEAGLKELARLGARTVLVYGDPGYYARFGFQAEAAERFVPPYALQYPTGWQAVALGEGGLPSEPVAFTCVVPLNQPDLW